MAYVFNYNIWARNGNQWSFDMGFAQETFKNALFLMILVFMDRAHSGELGTLYFCGCQMYISYFFFHFEVEKMAKIAIFQSPLAQYR